MPGIIGPTTAIGRRPHRVSLANPTSRVPDPDGGYIYEWAPCDPPQVFARIEPASMRQLGQLVAGTLVTTATHLVTLPFHPQVQQGTRLTFTTTAVHELLVIAAPVNLDSRDNELVLVCHEWVGTGPVPATATVSSALEQEAPGAVMPVVVR